MRLKDVLDDKILYQNQKNYDALRDKMSTGQITWVLGAGISVPAQLPQWDSLLAKMWARLYEITPRADGKMKDDVFMQVRQEKETQIRDYSKFLNKTKKAYKGEDKKVFYGVNTLESAEYLWNYIGDLVESNMDGETEDELKKRVLKTLIRDSLNVDASKMEIMKKLENQAINNLAELLANKKTGRVITYNYDDVLEMCLEKCKNLTTKDVSVICDCDLEKGDEEEKINIHHPHGALKVVGSSLSKESRNIILTESSYYKMEQKAYNWENSVQAKALVETSCIFMGFSGEDYNFRRIIKNIDFDMERETARHYIFFCLDDLLKSVYGENCSRCHEEEFIFEGIQLINRLYAQYSYWNHHGIIPIWSTFKELPGMVKQLAV